MSKIVAVLAVLMFAFAAQASASLGGGDYRAPDARPAVVTQDYRSPDAQKPIAFRATLVAPDLRSPDARPTGRFVPPVPGHTSSSFEWGYLALGIAMALLALGAVLITQRRRHHGLAIGR
jgi:hypothetical protein